MLSRTLNDDVAPWPLAIYTSAQMTTWRPADWTRPFLDNRSTKLGFGAVKDGPKGHAKARMAKRDVLDLAGSQRTTEASRNARHPDRSFADLVGLGVG